MTKLALLILIGEHSFSKINYRKESQDFYALSTYIGAAHIGIRIAADLLSGIAVGSGIGYVLDKVFDTRPFLFAVFLLFGGAAGFLNVYRMAKDEENKKGVR